MPTLQRLYRRYLCLPNNAPFPSSGPLLIFPICEEVDVCGLFSKIHDMTGMPTFMTGLDTCCIPSTICYHTPALSILRRSPSSRPLERTERASHFWHSRDKIWCPRCGVGFEAVQFFFSKYLSHPLGIKIIIASLPKIAMRCAL